MTDLETGVVWENHSPLLLVDGGIVHTHAWPLLQYC